MTNSSVYTKRQNITKLSIKESPISSKNSRKLFKRKEKKNLSMFSKNNNRASTTADKAAKI